jgi:hypothetical protein
MFEVTTSDSREGLRDSLRDQQREIAAFADGFSVEDLFADQGEHWSPAGHLRHLNKSVRAVAQGLEQNKLVLLPFGKAKNGSRSYEEVVEVYRQALADGGSAGSYGPSSKVPDLSPEEWREQIMEHWRDSSERLRRAMRRWSEKELDRYRLPHPLIGKLTLREMVYFTLYHNAHHARRVAERSGRSE